MRKTLIDHGLAGKGSRVGIGVSGGVDSMVLLRILHILSGQLDIKLSILHFEHGIRAEDSKADMEFVRSAAKALELPFYSGAEDVPKRARELRENLEATAREARYRFFAKCQRQYRIEKIALAHHMDDYAETFLFNLLRGSGPKGLDPMEVERAPGIIRPLLEATRVDIEAYAKEKAVLFRQDETNLNTAYTRNEIRHNIMPLLRKINPDASGAIRRAGRMIGADNALLQEQARDRYRTIAQAKDGYIYMPCDALLELPEALRGRVIRIAIGTLGTLADSSYDMVERILSLVKSAKTGKTFEIPNRFFACIHDNTLIIGHKMYTMDMSARYTLGLGMNSLWDGMSVYVEEARTPDVYPLKSSYTQFVDADGIKGAVMRTRQPGDVFAPFGMGGSKKLKDYMIDLKIPKFVREEVPLLCRGNEVLWVVGYGLSELLKVGAQTERVLCLNFARER